MVKLVVRDSIISDNRGAGISFEGSEHELDISGTRIERNDGGGIVTTIPLSVGDDFLLQIKDQNWYPPQISDEEIRIHLERIARSKNRTEAQDAVGSSPIWMFMKDKGVDLAQLTISILQALKIV